jgi:hypothetical protein
MGAPEVNTTLIYGIHLRESANDGSDFSNAASDYRVLYLGEDGQLHVKDSAGSIADIGGASSGAQTAHACRVVRASGNFAIGNNTYTEVEFNGTDTYDTDSMHDPSSSNTRITIPSISGVTTGLWIISAGGYSTPVTRIDAQIRKNAAGNPASGTSLGFDLRQTTTAIQGFQLVVQGVLTAGDYLELFVRSTGGSADIAFDAEGSPRMEVAFLGKVT